MINLEENNTYQNYRSMVVCFCISLFLFSFFVFNLMNAPLIFIAFVFILLEMDKIRKNLKTRTYWLHKFIFAYVLILFASTLMSVDRDVSYRMLLQIIPGIIIYFLVSDYVSKKHLYLIFYAYLVVALIISLKLLYIFSLHSLSYPPRFMMSESNLPFYTGNDVVFLVILSPFFFYCLQNTQKKFLKMMCLLGIALPFMVSIIYQSRLSLVIYILLILIYTILNHSKHLIKLFFAAAILFFLVDFINNFTLLAKFSDFSTFENRLILWLAAWKIFLSAPFLGSGLDTYFILYENAIKAANIETNLLYGIPWPHSLVFEILAEQGIIAFFLLGFIYFKTFYILYRSRLKETEYTDLKLVLLIVSIGFFFSLALELTFHRMWVSVFLFLLLAFMDKIARIENVH